MSIYYDTVKEFYEDIKDGLSKEKRKDLRSKLMDTIEIAEEDEEEYSEETAMEKLNNALDDIKEDLINGD